MSRRRRPADGPPTPPRRPPFFYTDTSNRVVYIAAEGTKTEGDYVRLLSRTYGQRRDGKGFRLHFCDPGKNGLPPVKVVELLLETAPDHDSERWALFDRDSEDHREEQIPAAMRLAKRHGIEVGYSHPSFELWLLLHFQQFTSQEGGSDKRVKEKLRGHPDALGFEQYDSASGERGKGLEGRRWESLCGREGTAVRNARRLVDRCPHGSCSATEADHAEDCDPLKRDPSTGVWRLLESLDIGGEDDGGIDRRKSSSRSRKGRRTT